MLKKLFFAVAALMFSMGFAFADVDVNKGDQAALDGIKGLGPAKSKAIIDERTKNGSFKDWADFESRVKGIGEKTGTKLSEAGLTVNGQAKSGAPAKAAPAKADKAAKAEKADKAEKTEKAPKAEKVEKSADKAKADTADKADKSAKAAKAEASASAKEGKTK
ncbi:MAG: ComEA family DNA-binding protein [Undibacterium curvum]|uniref:ComEA family DNA-binding protein n=1 Tax=Undibacterium curvum TaxID=2762294 RepID=UPI003BCBC0C3